jgi:hypothetical protein
MRVWTQFVSSAVLLGVAITSAFANDRQLANYYCLPRFAIFVAKQNGPLVRANHSTMAYPMIVLDGIQNIQTSEQITVLPSNRGTPFKSLTTPVIVVAIKEGNIWYGENIDDSFTDSTRDRFQTLDDVSAIALKEYCPVKDIAVKSVPVLQKMAVVSALGKSSAIALAQREWLTAVKRTSPHAPENERRLDEFMKQFLVVPASVEAGVPQQGERSHVP